MTELQAAQLAWLRLYGIEANGWEDQTVELPPGSMEQLIRMAEYMGGECEWFAMCTEAAEHWRRHPILGVVPVCEQHLSWEGK